jgi:anaerobic sulfite reductase subunit B
MEASTVAEPAPYGAMTPTLFRVAMREQEIADTWTVTLEPVGSAAPTIGPGQFMMVCALGIGEVPISVSGSRGRPGPVVLTVRAVGPVSRAICAAEPGAVLGLRGPFGTSWPVADAAGGDVVVVAGGIGLAPLRPVVLRVLERPADYGKVTVLYGARTPMDLLYLSQLEDWRRQIEVAVTVDTAGGEWGGQVGFVAKLVQRASIRPDRVTAFVCGPEIMMRTTVDALVARGVSASRIHLSMERHMDCGIGLCGHCQLGPTLICRDGPVYAYPEIAPLLEVRQL